MGSPEWFAAQREMIRTKPLIRRCYDIWYKRLLGDADSVPVRFRHAAVVELGSGASYIKELRPEIITSDLSLGVADMVIDGRALPFADESVGALLLTHVFHHIPDVRLFFREAIRVLVPGGVISMVDVTHTRFARFFFSTCHPEPYDDRTPDWCFAPGDTMLHSNQALSWIVFSRDRKQFEQEFPELSVERFSHLPWFSYLISGGVNLRSFVPGFAVGICPRIDRLLEPLDPFFAVHWHITLRKASRVGRHD